MKNINIEQIFNYYFKDKYSLNKIANLIGDVSPSTIGNRLKKYGYTLDNKSHDGNNRKHSIDINFFKEINNKNKAYILGLIISDGYVNKFKLTFTSKDSELVEIFKRELKSEHKLAKYDIFDKRTNKTYTRYSLQIASKEIVDDLNKLGIYPNKSFTCEMPNIPNEYFWHFIRGVFDGDGSITNEKNQKKGRLRFQIIGSEALLKQIKHDFLRYHISNNTKLTNTVYQSSNNYISKIFYYSYHDLNIIKNEMYYDSETLRLSRKYEIFQTLREYRQGTYNRLSKLRKIEMFDYNTKQYIRTFNNIHELCDIMKIKDKCIRRVISGERNHTKGYFFKYI
jgi:hypothetical protein